jgi:2-polyprenyl-3-methyl-5-hydroxy-6-metoxy-1,4-benzoquinol methylase
VCLLLLVRATQTPSHRALRTIPMRMAVAITRIELEVCGYLQPAPICLSRGPTLIANGREEYFAPNDDAENDRLDMHHHLATLLLGRKLHVAPIDSQPQRILDVGCGTGIWSIDMGRLPTRGCTKHSPRPCYHVAD